MATATNTRDIEHQEEPLGRRNRLPAIINKSDEPETAGNGTASTQIWKLYGTESEKYDKALVDSWKSNTDSMLIFTGLFSSIVASFLIQTSQGLLPDNGSQTVSLLTQLVAQSNNGAATVSPQSLVQQNATPSAVRVNILMFLSLFFSVTSALVSTLIQQWAREYLQYSQPSAVPHKRARVRTYLFDGLSHFQMRRLTYGVPVLLHLAVFLFFFALSEWLYSINIPVGATARYCLVALLAVYIALSILPLIVKNAPYQTALTTPLQACVSFITFSFIALFLLVRHSSGVYDAKFSSIHVDRGRALMKEIKKRSSKLDRSAMHWLLQHIDDDDMDTLLSGLPGYIYSPLTDTKLVVEGLQEDGVPGRIREHFTTCVISMELSQEESMSRASACINSLRLISEAAANTSVRRPGAENNDIEAILRYLEPLCCISNSVTALRASCVRGLVIREFMFPLTHLDAAELQTKKFPDHLKPLYMIIRVWKTEIDQWSHLIGASPDPLPSDYEMWADVIYDGPLINLAVFSYAVVSHACEEEVNLNMAWKTLKSLLKTLGLAQVQASASARARFDQVLLKVKAHTSISGCEGGRAQITPFLEALETVINGLHLATVFASTPSTKIPPRRIEAIFGQEQLRNSELLETFAAHLPKFVNACAPEISTTFMEHLILKNKLWEQLVHVSLSKCFQPYVPFPDKLRVVVAFLDILDVAFLHLTDSSKVDWQAQEFDLLIGHLNEFGRTVARGMFVGEVANFRTIITPMQLCHALLVQFSGQRRRGEPLVTRSFNGLVRLIRILGLGTQEDREYLITKNADTNPDLMVKAEAILDVTLRDGPLSNFCKLGRRTFEAMLNRASTLSTEDFKRPWALLRRILDTPHLPLVNASEGMWTKFDHLRTAVLDTAALEASGKNAEKLQPLLEMIEEVHRMRPAAGDRADGTGSDDHQTRAQAAMVKEPQQSNKVPIPGSSMDPEVSRPGSSTNSSLPPVLGFDRSASGAVVGPVSMGANQPPSSSIRTTQPGLDAKDILFPYPPHAPQGHPLSFAPHHFPGMPGSQCLDPTNLQPQTYMRSVDTAPTSVPIPQGYMAPHAYPYPIAFPSPVPSPLGRSSFPVGAASGGRPTPPSMYEGDDPGDEWAGKITKAK